MAKIKILNDTQGDPSDAIFNCPACDRAHPIRIASKCGAPVWNWNGDLDKPTFTPSLLVYPHNSQRRCHSFVTDGRIEFCGDSDHELAGQTVDLPDME